MHTVALLGHTGSLGVEILKPLIDAHQAGKIKLIILHRPSSDTSKVPSEIEKRVVDLEKGDISELKTAVAGIHVLVSAVTTTAVLSQLPLVEALVGSPDLLSFMPSEYGFVWTEKDSKGHPELGFLGLKDQVTDRAREVGVPYTIVKAGLFPELGFSVPTFGLNLKENRVEISRKSRTSLAPFATIPYTGQAIAQLVITRPHELGNQKFDVIEYEKTGEDFIKVFAKIHGKEPEVVQKSDADWDALMAKNGIESLTAGVNRKWGDHDYVWLGERVKVEGFESKTLEESARDFLSQA